MAIQTLQTKNFTINFDPVAVPNSEQRANAIFQVCEHEFTTLANWFGVTSGFGVGNRIIVNIKLGLGTPANNFGFKSDGTTTINVDATGIHDDASAAEYVRMAFVCEFAEVLMSYRNSQGPTTWAFATSNWEGLSQFCGLLRFPIGYKLYASTPLVNVWLQLSTRNDPAHDWITNAENSEVNVESFGCSLLYLFYLKDQLGFAIPDIIQKGGSTLAITYQNLTGKTDAAAAFKNLLNAYFPVGNTPTLSTNNPFPLLTGASRQVYIDTQASPNDVGTAAVDSGTVAISPGLPFLCPPKRYSFTIYGTPQGVKCVATCRGFGQPVYNWRINGMDVPAKGEIAPMANVFIDDPRLPSGGKAETRAVQIACSISSDSSSSTLLMAFRITSQNVCHIDIIIEAFAQEKFASTDVTSGVEWWTVDNEKVYWDPPYDADRAACKAKWENLVHRFVQYDPWFNIIRTLPDPQPDYGQVLRQLEQISIAIKKQERHSPEDARQLEQAVEHLLGVNASILHEIGKLGSVTRATSR